MASARKGEFSQHISAPASFREVVRNHPFHRDKLRMILVFGQATDGLTQAPCAFPPCATPQPARLHRPARKGSGYSAVSDRQRQRVPLANYRAIESRGKTDRNDPMYRQLPLARDNEMNAEPMSKTKDQYASIIDHISVPNSPVGIDAQLTHAIIITYLQQIAGRLDKIEAQLSKRKTG